MEKVSSKASLLPPSEASRDFSSSYFHPSTFSPVKRTSKSGSDKWGWKSISDLSELSDASFLNELNAIPFFPLNTKVNVKNICDKTGQVKYVRGSVSGFDPINNYYSIDYEDGEWGELEEHEIFTYMILEDFQDEISFAMV
jgi:hypothetical protein